MLDGQRISRRSYRLRAAAWWLAFVICCVFIVAWSWLLVYLSDVIA